MTDMMSERDFVSPPAAPKPSPTMWWQNQLDSAVES